MESRFAHSGSHRARKAITTPHVIAVDRTATRSLVITMSVVVNGRTARIGGTAKSADQKSGLENAFPTGIARPTGITRITNRIRKLSAGLSRRYQDTGAITKMRRPATSDGNTVPERRHSNQNCAA